MVYGKDDIGEVICLKHDVVLCPAQLLTSSVKAAALIAASAVGSAATSTTDTSHRGSELLRGLPDGG